nr:MAG TPA: hypothetical protein [Caudoviricetes sp.]
MVKYTHERRKQQNLQLLFGIKSNTTCVLERLVDRHKQQKQKHAKL